MEYGVKIKNIEAATVYEVNAGIREHIEWKHGMFANSLFLDFLLEHGLSVNKDGATKDIICLEFNYGTRSFEQQMKNLKSTARQTAIRYRHAYMEHDERLKDITAKKRIHLGELTKRAIRNKKNYCKLSAHEIREIFYRDGIDIQFPDETIHYQMLFRSAGKAKKGTCMFIRKELYQVARDFLYMGIELSPDRPMIVESSAYIPLVSSAIVDRVTIDPRNILILEDIDSTTKTDVISVETDENKQCVARLLKDYTVKNSLFDGQALIDSSIFPDWGNGYILLRHHFCKMAAFHTELQTFFREYYGDQYDTATVTDMFGATHRVRDIVLVTTDNAMKWIKFGVTYDHWCGKVNENGNQFGIVKTAHESKLGSVQRMSYQMVNALDEQIMEDVVRESMDYLMKLKTDNTELFSFLRKNKNFANDYEVLVELCAYNPEFAQSEYFLLRKQQILQTYLKNLKSGHLIQNGENLVIVGSPYAMLLYGATGNKEIALTDPTFRTEETAIQCYTQRFADGEHLAAFRSPFNSKNNMGHLHNVYHEYFDRYFHLGKQIVAVNLIGTDFQDRNNGSDQDSDTIYTTNQKSIVWYAKHCYEHYPTIVNNIPKETKRYELCMKSYSDIDNSLADAQMEIGESSNLAQICLTYTYNFSDRKYLDYACILSVLAQVAIDSAKRRFDINLSGEIQRIKQDMDIANIKYPSFWKIIHPNYNLRNINRRLRCPMNYLYDLRAPRKARSTQEWLPIDYFYQSFPLEEKRRKCKKVEDFIVKYSIQLFKSYTSDEKLDSDEMFLLRSDFEELIEDIRRIYVSKSYLGLFSWLLARAFSINEEELPDSEKKQISKNKSLLFRVLYEVNKDNLFKCLSKNMT